MGDRGPTLDFWILPGIFPEEIRRIADAGLDGSTLLDPSIAVFGPQPRLYERLLREAAWRAAGRGMFRRDAMLAGGGGDLNESAVGVGIP